MSKATDYLCCSIYDTNKIINPGFSLLGKNLPFGIGVK
jgi:hypothetical protein